METLVTDLQKPIGQKLIDADKLNNGNYYESLFDYVEELRFIIYIRKIKNRHDITGE